MPTKEELLETTEKLYEEKKYKEIIELLTNKILKQHNIAELFRIRGNSWYGIDDFDKAISDFNKAIELKTDYSEAYNNRGNAWFYKKEYDKAIEDYNESIRLNPKYKIAYANRANCWNQKNNFDNAIEDYSKAIEIDPDYVEAYHNRGNIWGKKKEYKKAIEDFNEAIKRKPEYARAFYNRGFVWSELNEKEKALEDYSKAILLKPDYEAAFFNRGYTYYEKKDTELALDDYNKVIELNPLGQSAYNNRGIIWSSQKDYDKAIEDYNKAIELKPDYVISYYNRGNAWYDKNDLYKAIEDYNKAIELNPNYEKAKYWRDRAKARLGETIKTDEKKLDNSFYLFIKALELVSEEEKKKILEKCDNIMDDIVNKIREYASDSKEENVAHYSKLRVADILVSVDKSYLRYYNAVYMNDPEEGKIFLEYLNDVNIDKSFKNGQKGEENNIYLGSFLPASQHEDELVMWRTYGKDEEKNEAAGCSIVLENNFFDYERSYLFAEMRRGSEDEMKSESVTRFAPQSLYRVLYYDKRKKTIAGLYKNEIEKEVKRLKVALKELIKLKDIRDKSSDKNLAIDKIIFYIISELRYFFKSADYAFENELRVIQFASSESDNVKIDGENGQQLPRKMFIESSKQIHQYIKKIVLGPKVPHPDQWMYLEALMKKRGYKMELKNSECKFQ